MPRDLTLDLLGRVTDFLPYRTAASCRIVSHRWCQAAVREIE